MGFYFKQGWQPPPRLSPEVATEFLKKLFTPSQPPILEVPSVNSVHIGEYIEDLMYSEGYNIVDLTIIKQNNGKLIFKINKKD